MKRKKTSRLLCLATLAIVSILTACPAAESGGAGSGGGSKGDSVTGPKFQSLDIDVAQKKIIVSFNTKISGKPDASRITVKRGPTPLLAAEYTPTIENGKLIIKLNTVPTSGAQYTVELQAGAVKDANGKANIANTASKDKTLTVSFIQAVTPGALTFKANSNTVLTLSFNTNIEIVDRAKIRMEVKPDGNEKFSNAPVSSIKVNTRTLELTLAKPAVDDNVYRVKVGVGALRATVSKLANAGELTSSETTYSTSPILNPAPYILDNKLVAPFNLSIELRDWEKVKVYKNPAGSNEEINLKQDDIAVNSDNLLEITLPAVQTTEVYRLRLEPGAVNEEDKTANENEVIESADINIEAAPALDADNDPYLYGQKIIVPFNAPIIILDGTKIKYLLKNDGESEFGEAITPDSTPIVENNNQLEIPLNAIPEGGQVYRIDLDAGALRGGLGKGKNQPSMGAIRPGDKDITVIEPTLTNVKPVATSKTQLSITLPPNVAIVGDGSRINVQKKDDRDDPDTAADESSFRNVSSRTIEVDDTDTKKINITLTDDEEITPYTQVWRLIFPPNTLETAKSRIPNSRPLTTEGAEKPRLTDLYSWREITAEGDKWSKRSGHTSVVFDSKIWVMGGQLARELLNDVWSSEDGVTWTEETPQGSDKKITSGSDANWWTARTGHTSVMFDSKIWVMGGSDGKILNDVWSSPDGAKWTQVDNAAKWPARYYHNSLVFDPDRNGERIWVLGGFNGNDLNDVWSSKDGSTWTESTPPGEASKKTDGADANWWKPRYFSGSAVFQNKIWIAGGSFTSEDFSIDDKSYSTLWSSSDGQTWTKGNDFDNNLNLHSMVAFEGRLWNLGGVLNTKSTTNRIRSSVTPAGSWVEEKVLPSKRQAHSTVIFDDKIWVIGGGAGGTSGVDNKVFVLEPNSP